MKTIEEQMADLNALIARRERNLEAASEATKEPARRALQAAIDAKETLTRSLQGSR